MTDAWRLDQGTLGGSFALGTVVKLVPFGGELRLQTPEGAALLRLDADKVTQDVADSGLSMHLTSQAYGIDAALARVTVRPTTGAPTPSLPPWSPAAGEAPPPILVRTYSAGSQKEAALQMTGDAAALARYAYAPAGQSWAGGGYGSGVAWIALFLILLVVAGLLYFWPFLVVAILVAVVLPLTAPPGSLTVTYELRGTPSSDAAPPAAASDNNDSKVCPRCAETVKRAAQVCRFCGHEFDEPSA
jgi:hypothetical protein